MQGKFRGACGLVAVAMLWMTGCGDAGNASSSGAPGAQAQSGTGDALWCEEHGVEEKYCVICHPEIRENEDMLLCPKHGNIPEAICTACHPELKQKYETCPHELPPAFCQTCAREAGDADGKDHKHEHEDQHEGEKQT